MSSRATVIGGGLAGCEAAFQLAERGVSVRLYDMKPYKKSPAHNNDNLCELVCSNSLRSDRLENAAGLLKEELRRLGSLVIRAADSTRIPAGGALAVDREAFPKAVTKALKNHKNIDVISEEVMLIPQAPAIIATGPLTDGELYLAIEQLTGSALHFYDAAAPVVYSDSLNMDVVFRASRYDRGDDYLNCPLNKEEYARFYNELVSAETVKLHDFETPRVFEGCMPIETMARRGERTLAFGPLKPVGLTDPRTGIRPYAVVQLRQDDAAGSLYNIVGFQTNLTFKEQCRVFRMIPGMENAEFARYGVMHRNTFLRSPRFLDDTYQVVSVPGLYFAGQITGVEGYVESAASGFLSGVSLARKMNGENAIDFTGRTAIGALGKYVSGYAGDDFQPMNITYGLIDALPDAPRNKQLRYSLIAERSFSIVDEIRAQIM